MFRVRRWLWNMRSLCRHLPIPCRRHHPTGTVCHCAANLINASSDNGDVVVHASLAFGPAVLRCAGARGFATAEHATGDVHPQDGWLLGATTLRAPNATDANNDDVWIACTDGHERHGDNAG